MKRWPLIALLLTLLLAPDPAPAGDQDQAEPPRGTYKSAADVKAAHDRALVRDLEAYIQANPKAEDLEQAYMMLFETVIEHDWFLDTEAAAKTYLARHPEGAVVPLARIVAAMARAQAGQFAEALPIYKELIKGLDQDDQEEFASNFADSLASAAMTAGAYKVAREVYETLLERFKDHRELHDKVRDDLARLDMVGKPAPTLVVKDINGKLFRLSDLKGKYVLVDFWATWCAPCVAELPNMQAAYNKYHAQGLEIVGISLDETKDPLLDFLKARKIPWRQIHNATSGGDAVEAFGVSTIPATFLIGPDGTILRLELRGPALEKALNQLIK
ncbi:MAG: TlpA family protein disulfide reductase [Isosphaeraceae bacterium]|nr:TlpA family protein disulfide reductase [Isosphaeraceae bacterium]